MNPQLVGLDDSEGAKDADRCIDGAMEDEGHVDIGGFNEGVIDDDQFNVTLLISKAFLILFSEMVALPLMMQLHLASSSAHAMQTPSTLLQ